MPRSPRTGDHRSPSRLSRTPPRSRCPSRRLLRERQFAWREETRAPRRQRMTDRQGPLRPRRTGPWETATSGPSHRELTLALYVSSTLEALASSTLLFWIPQPRYHPPLLF